MDPPGRPGKAGAFGKDATAMSQTYRCDHLHLRSRDAAAAAAFYVEALGARETARMPVRDRLRVILDLGGLTVFIEEVPADTAAAPPAPFVGIEHIGLAVDSPTTAPAAPRSPPKRSRCGRACGSPFWKGRTAWCWNCWNGAPPDWEAASSLRAARGKGQGNEFP